MSVWSVDFQGRTALALAAEGGHANATLLLKVCGVSETTPAIRKYVSTYLPRRSIPRGETLCDQSRRCIEYIVDQQVDIRKARVAVAVRDLFASLLSACDCALRHPAMPKSSSSESVCRCDFCQHPTSHVIIDKTTTPGLH